MGEVITSGSATAAPPVESPHEPVKATRSWPNPIPAERLLALPFAFSLGVAGLALLPAVRANVIVWWAMLGAGFALIAWNAALLGSARRRARVLRLDIALRKQHYLQACSQALVLVYW